MPAYKIYLKNNSTVIQDLASTESNVIQVNARIDSSKKTVYLKSVNDPSKGWFLNYDEIFDEDGNQIDATGEDDAVVLEYITLNTNFNTAPGGSGAIMFKEVLISSSELLDMAENNPEILPAPGINRYYYPIAVNLKYNFGTAAYLDENNGAYFLANLGVSDIDPSLLTAISSRCINLPVSINQRALSSVVNTPVLLSTDDPTPGYPNTGDGTLLIQIWYTIQII